MLTLLLSTPGAIAAWALFAVSAVLAIRAFWRARGLEGAAAVATARANKAEEALAGVSAERDAHRKRAEQESAARELAVNEAAELRRRLAERATPQSVAEDFDRAFGGKA
jgi:hypothetical protein